MSSATTITATATATAIKPALRHSGMPPVPPHPPKSSLPPFLPPPLTPSIGIRTRTHRVRDGPPGTAHIKPLTYAPGVKVRYGGAGPGREGIPMPLSPQELPAKYKGAERRVRTAIIALPIAIVTSWVLYNRLVKGEERKVLVKPEGGK